jgi:Leucine-rich repeat (LRR) protein/PKD repeat protein
MSLQTAFLYPLQAALSPKNNGWLRRLLVGIALTLATLSVAQAATDCNAVTEISKVECESLLQLYHSTDGANWANNEGWNVTNTPCSWKGITCANNGVTKIYLSGYSSNNNLNGTIPDFSGLPNLTELDLSFNKLTGTVPDFSGLPNLTYLKLDWNKLTGAVPDFSGLPNLTSLNLGWNKLTGAVPDFSGLPNLIRLELDNNQLTGAVPDFSGLPNLTELYLYNNQLTGAVPDFSGLPNLTYLALGSNKLTGTVPDFSGLPKLTYLHLANNQLTGAVPDFSGLPNLTELYLANNQLTGAVPDFSGLPNLTYLALGLNKLTGAVPDFSGLPNLTKLYLDNNQLTGTVPDFSGLPNLTYLALGLNKLTGAVPDFSGLPNLTSLNLYNNKLTGAVPDFSGLPNLTSIWLSSNQLTGAVPDFSELPNLEVLALSNNQLTGTIPDLSTLTNLNDLALHDNQLCKDSHINYATWPIEYAYLSGYFWKSSPTWQEVLNGFPNCPVNQAPTAQFTVSPSQGDAPLTVNLDASQSADTDGTINQYNWTANGQTLSGKTTSTTFTAAGEYTIVLTVTDNQGLTATTQKTVIVTPPNQAPTAQFTASPSQGVAPLTVNLDASQSADTDGTITQYNWTANGQTLSGKTTSTTFTAAGEYTIVLTVTDNQGLTATTQKTVIVTPPNQAPTAQFTASPSQGVAPLTVNLDASQSADTDGTITQYNWTANGQTLSGKTTSTTFTAAGEYTIVLTVTDNQGLTATTEKTVIVTRPNQAPTAQFTASPSQGMAPLTVNLDASQSTDTDGTINQYNWTANGQTLSGKTTSTTFTAAGEYTIVLTVTDNQGLTATTEKTVIVTRPNQAPTAQFTASPSQGKAPLTVNLDASDSKDGGTPIVNYEWLVNGQKLFGIKAAITLTAAGEYPITLTVTDNDGLTATQQQTITVTSAITVVEPATGADQAIIIAAGSAHKNTLFHYTNDFTQRFYRLLKQQGFQDDDIHYLNPHAPDIDPWDGYLENERQDFDLFDPELELLQAFKQAGERLKAGQRLVLYLHGHARPNYFKIKRDYELSAETFSQLLTRIPDGVEQVIILDTCFAGSFLDELKGVANRIVVSSSDEKSRAWEIKHGSFSDQLIREIRRGQNLNEAFTTASEMITSQPALFRGQQPCLDDDGDGQCTSRDGRRSAQIVLADKHGEQVPEIVQVHPRRTLSGATATATLWVTVLPSTPDAIKQVRAILIRPNLPVADYQGELTDFGRTELPLLYNAAKQRYEGDYEHFCTSGSWHILYQVQNTDGVWSDIKKGNLEQAPNIQAPICRVPMTLNLGLNNFRYTAGDTFRLDMTVDGEGLADIYVAIVFPNGDFITLTYPDKFSFLNIPNPYRQRVTISGQRVYSSVLDLALPPGLPLGHYSACGVLVQPTAVNVLDTNNWIHLQCEVFELF